ncbi:MAG: malonyl-ACP O-methyltransferase BioC [Zoogloeaceae bacterium]|jgi:malonyl-CoA O-methyltransferase|nr:malonyl-ACP O-methyltransferase BioC [Zoogloeaceae bacterium]
MNQHVIRRSFDRAAASYDTAANLQRRVCQLLLDQLAEPAPARILDAGCGTGYALGLFGSRWPAAQLTALDFAPAMVAAAKAQASGVCANIEALPFAAASFDLYWSSLSFQWCDAARAVAEAARVLAPGGRLAVSSLASGTLAELHAAFSGVDSHRHVLEFSPPDTLAQACAAAGLINIRWIKQTLRFHYPILPALLRELKALGANQVGGSRRAGLMGRKTWQAVEQRYESRRETAGLPATYEAILCTASKPVS